MRKFIFILMMLLNTATLMGQSLLKTYFYDDGTSALRAEVTEAIRNTEEIYANRYKPSLSIEADNIFLSAMTFSTATMEGEVMYSGGKGTMLSIICSPNLSKRMFIGADIVHLNYQDGKVSGMDSKRELLDYCCNNPFPEYTSACINIGSALASGTSFYGTACAGFCFGKGNEYPLNSKLDCGGSIKIAARLYLTKFLAFNAKVSVESYVHENYDIVCYSLAAGLTLSL